MIAPGGRPPVTEAGNQSHHQEGGHQHRDRIGCRQRNLGAKAGGTQRPRIKVEVDQPINRIRRPRADGKCHVRRPARVVRLSGSSWKTLRRVYRTRNENPGETGRSSNSICDPSDPCVSARRRSVGQRLQPTNQQFRPGRPAPRQAAPAPATTAPPRHRRRAGCRPAGR